MSTFGIARVDTGGGQHLAAHRGHQVFVLDDILNDPPTTLEDAFTDWDGFVDTVEKALEMAPTGSGRPADTVEFLPAAGEHCTLYGAGANYRSHVDEMGVAAIPALFQYAAPVVNANGHSRPVVRPMGVRELDWEVELAVIIGRAARNVPVDQAWSYIAGYTVANDVSVRDVPRHEIFGYQWIKMKYGDGLTPIGPSIVPARLVPDVQQLHLTMHVNAELRQEAWVHQMLIGIPQQLAEVTKWLTLKPGDVLLTGTPGGTGISIGKYIDDGDVMIAEIQGIGRLENRVHPFAGQDDRSGA